MSLSKTREEAIEHARDFYRIVIEPRSHQRNVAYKVAYLIDHCKFHGVNIPEDLWVTPKELAICVINGLKNAIENNRRLGNLWVVNDFTIRLEIIKQSLKESETKLNVLRSEDVLKAILAGFKGLDRELASYPGYLFWG